MLIIDWGYTVIPINPKDLQLIPLYESVNLFISVMSVFKPLY